MKRSRDEVSQRENQYCPETNMNRSRIFVDKMIDSIGADIDTIKMRFKSEICDGTECLNNWLNIRADENTNCFIGDLIIDYNNNPPSKIDFALYHCECHSLVIWGKNDVRCTRCAKIYCQSCADKKGDIDEEEDEYMCFLCKPNLLQSNAKIREMEEMKKKSIVFSVIYIQSTFKDVDDFVINRITGMTCYYNGNDLSELFKLNTSENMSVEMCNFLEKSQEMTDTKGLSKLVIVVLSKDIQLMLINKLIRNDPRCKYNLPKTPLSGNWTNIIDIIDCNRGRLGLKGMKCDPWENNVSPIKYPYKHTNDCELYLKDIIKNFMSLIST